MSPDVHKMPFSIVQAASLEVINASRNKLKKLPPKLSLTSLQLLDVSHNEINTLHKNIYKLPITLNISHNNLPELPEVTIKGVWSSSVSCKGLHPKQEI